MEEYGINLWNEGIDDRLYDFRGQPELQMTELMIQHPSSITNMRQIEDHLLVVAGLENTVYPEHVFVLMKACYV
jgi:hypothetical protein